MQGLLIAGKRGMRPAWSAALRHRPGAVMYRRYYKATRNPDGKRSTARAYADVNNQHPREYWDYEDYQLEWRCAKTIWIGNGVLGQGCLWYEE